MSKPTARIERRLSVRLQNSLRSGGMKVEASVIVPGGSTSQGPPRSCGSKADGTAGGARHQPAKAQPGHVDEVLVVAPFEVHVVLREQGVFDHRVDTVGRPHGRNRADL